ncbi:unnamed protein product, partial [marine sediment metagenome]
FVDWDVHVHDDTKYISATNAIVRFYHTENGNAGDHLYLDHVALAY